MLGALSPANAGTSVKMTLSRESNFDWVVVGRTPAEINANFTTVMYERLLYLHQMSGDNAVYKFFYQMSTLQLYEFETVYNQSPHPTGIPTTVFGLMLTRGMFTSSYAAHAAITRLATVNLMYNSSYPGTTVPGGRKPVQKIGEIGGYPAQTTLTQVLAEYTSIEGLSATEGLVLGIARFAPIASMYFGGGWVLGSAISWSIQTYDPDLQIAASGLLGETAIALGLGIQTEFDIAQAIQSVEYQGSPGLNMVDFDGIQLGAITTAEMLPSD